MRGAILRLLLALALLPGAAFADESPVGMSEVDTKDLKLYYPDSLSYLVPHVVRTFTNSLEWQRRMFGWVPSEPITIQLQDLGDYGNASTFGAPHSTMFVDVAPLSHAFEAHTASERFYSLMNHELVHVMSNDISSDEDRRWRRFFLGKVQAQRANPESLLYSYLTVPRFTAPRWYLEGGAVFFETWMAGGLGRAQGGYDEMVFRAMVRDNAHFYDPLGLASRAVQTDFQIGANAYLYGTRFFTWLAYAYSPEEVVEWYRRDEGSRRYWSDQFEQVFGLPVEKAWQDWIAFEREFQRKNLEEVRKNPITPYRTLVGSPVGSVSRVYYDEATGDLYGGFRVPGVVEYIGALSTRDGSIRRITDIKRAMLYKVTSFAYDPSTGTAFFTNDNQGYLSFRDLMAVDVKTGETRQLGENARIGEIVVNPVDHALWGVRHENGIASLVRVPPPYDTSYRVYTFPYGVVPSDLDVSPDGQMLSASVNEVNSDQVLRVWEIKKLLNGDIKPLSEYSFGQSVPESFVFSKDGRYLYGSSYYTGVSNIFRYEVATGSVEAVSNAEIGFFRPVPLADGRLVVLNYTADGFVPAIIDPKPIADVSAIRFLGTELVEKSPVVKTWQVASPSSIDEEKLVTYKGPYDPLRRIELTNAFPVLQGYKNYVGVGYHFNFDDPLTFASLGITAAYTPSTNLPSEERGHVDITGRYKYWTAELSWNRSDFYDLFGPTKRSRKGYAAKLGYDWQLYNDEPRILDVLFNYAYYDQIDTLPGAQNIATNFTRLMTGEVALRYTDVKRSIGAVDDEKGIRWLVDYTGNLVNGQTVPQVRGELDLGFALPLPNSSIWLRTAGGFANGDRNNTVANFYFGGFGNNYVDDKSIKRYRDYDKFPGFEIDQISALSFVRGMGEWNITPYVFESAGTPSLYLQWLRPSVFVAGLWADPGNSTLRKTYTSVGGQLDMHFSVLHWYEMTLSVGVAAGYTGSQRTGSEWMISLKIM
ncbi:MAG TPA: hypothetical protein VFJ68_01725 [Casimicrobiaceae bacterium]|nr:hypothetical protein [Casimicrobiaceae bacterium]